METVPIAKFKANCLAILKMVKKTGQPVLITRRGEPVAQITPPPPTENHSDWLGCMKGRAQILGDIVSPIPEAEELWTGDWENLKK